MKKARIGIFGGTFNPIHAGHMRAAEIVQRKFLLDKILFIPSYIPPHKESVDMASPSDRLKMVELACAPYSRFIPSPIEIEAQEKSYSIITLEKIEKMYPETWLFFILGIDAFLEIETWKEYEELLKRCSFIVVSRQGYRLQEAKNVLEGPYKEKMYEFPESGEREEDLFSSYRIFLLPIDSLNIASTEIRRRARKGLSLKGLVLESVEVYIAENRLYQSQNG
ncbi:MAG: nicotinate (nicotinamide) nucleotide adenylyltransferase [Candidatus Aminicenantes bacterium]|nr:nicotinate (nicotinamide) nucleotide adenylyltransferase [Candidatus Aminicenantes bacterium]